MNGILNFLRQLIPGHERDQRAQRLKTEERQRQVEGVVSDAERIRHQLDIEIEGMKRGHQGIQRSKG